MISTNKIQPQMVSHEGERLRIVTTNKLTPKTFDFTPREFPGVDKRQTRIVKGGMLTTYDLEEKKRLAKRADCAAAKKAIKVARAQAARAPEKKKAGRPRKQE